MGETSTIRVSGNEVFGGAALTLKISKKGWRYSALGKIPDIPAAWRLGEINSVGFSSPRITIDGFYDASSTHAANTTASQFDWQFGNELISASGPKYFKDDQIKPPAGSEMIVWIESFDLTFDANKTEAPNVGDATQPFRLVFSVGSGTPWWSGTGILQ